MGMAIQGNIMYRTFLQSHGKYRITIFAFDINIFNFFQQIFNDILGTFGWFFWRFYYKYFNI